MYTEIIIGFLLLAIIKCYNDNRRSNVHRLPRVKRTNNSTHFIWGHFKQAVGKFSEVFTDYCNEYGSTFVIDSVFCKHIIHTIDEFALSHILRKNSYDYPKPVGARRTIDSTIGEFGLVASEGDYHRQLKKLMTAPLNSPKNLQSFVQSIKFKDEELTKALKTHINEDLTELNMLPFIESLAADNIGLTGFNYDLKLLSHLDKNIISHHSSIANAVEHFSNSKGDATITYFLQFVFPFMALLPTKSRKLNITHLNEFRKTAYELYNEKYNTISHSLKIGEEINVQRDILSLIIESNIKNNSSNQALTKDEIIAQITTLIIAGIDTTSVTISWMIYALAQNQEAQNKLRKEIVESEVAYKDNPTLNEINSLDYLDKCVKETNRLYAAVANTLREASKDDVIPLKYPVKNNKTGEVITEIKVKKGQQILIPIHSYNRSNLYWEDGEKYIPERWYNDNINLNPQILTFIDGTRMCVGMKLALLEIKLTIIELIKNFEFHPSSYKIIPRGRLTLHPRVESMEGVRMNVKVKAL